MLGFNGIPFVVFLKGTACCLDTFPYLSNGEMLERGFLKLPLAKLLLPETLPIADGNT
jgi:hypothetical protein